MHTAGQVGDSVAASRKRRRASLSVRPSRWHTLQPRQEAVRPLVMNLILTLLLLLFWWKPVESAAPQVPHVWHSADQILDKYLERWEPKLLYGSALCSLTQHSQQLQTTKGKSYTWAISKACTSTSLPSCRTKETTEGQNSVHTLVKLPRSDHLS